MSVKCEREMKWNRVVREWLCARECECVTGKQCRMKDCGKKVCWAGKKVCCVANVRVSDII